MTFIRNEILEVGQEVLLYTRSQWRGEIRCMGTLVCKLEGGSESPSELWRIIPADNGWLRTWWIGNPNMYDKVLSSEI